MLVRRLCRRRKGQAAVFCRGMLRPGCEKNEQRQTAVVKMDALEGGREVIRREWIPLRNGKSTQRCGQARCPLSRCDIISRCR